MRGNDSYGLPTEIQPLQGSLHFRRIGSPVNRTHDEDGIISRDICWLPLDRSISNTILGLLDAGVVVLRVRYSWFHFKHIRAGQFLQVFGNYLRITLVDITDSIVLVRTTEIDDFPFSLRLQPPQSRQP